MFWSVEQRSDLEASPTYPHTLEPLRRVKYNEIEDERTNILQRYLPPFSL